MQSSLFKRLISSLRSNWLTFLIFFTIGLGVLYGQQVLLQVTAALNGVDLHQVAQKAPDNMTSAEVDTVKQASGWVPAGTGSKFLFAAGYFFLFIGLVWLAQSITAKPAKRWAKKYYAREFGYLSGYERFKEYQQGRWQLIALACASIIAAALIV
ncbi:hypothetical protein [Hymenobacter wooponensis]|uniref:Uncharacterized protein n=1 Tax=Hymenobacter wooponensis TaxID=1525360 RepID=A0A4Z0MTW0_9BACT|nr:hypothetical protein [Hymenobacter wooponensis]TGD82880.1 hypothetical protein EU557_03610 [Hymenobacter wooponensis]